MGSASDPLQTGRLNAALANEIGAYVAEFTGRGATRSRAFVDQDVVVCLLEDNATRAERNLVAAGQAELVRRQRDAQARAMESELVARVERLTGRTVRTFLAGTSTLSDSSVKIFVLVPDPLEDQGNTRPTSGAHRVR